jgi:hypothetical protein
MYKRANSGGDRISFRVKSRGWESPAVELRRKVSSLKEDNRILREENESFQKGVIGNYNVDVIITNNQMTHYYYKAIQLTEINNELREMVSSLQEVLLGAKEKILEQDLIISKMATGNRKIILC